MNAKIVSEYDQEIPQSQTADNPWHREEEPLNHHETPGRQIKQSNQQVASLLSSHICYEKIVYVSIKDHMSSLNWNQTLGKIHYIYRVITA